MTNAGKVCAVAVLAALAWAVAPVAEAQAPIRIGAKIDHNTSSADSGSIGIGSGSGARCC